MLQVHLQSTPSSSLPKAKIKTLKMTVVMVVAFILCGMPYPILEMIYSFGDHRIVSPELAGILGSMAVANSAANPYVFLLFNANLSCLRSILGAVPCFNRRLQASPSKRSEYMNRSEDTLNTEMSRSHTLRSVHPPHDVVELSMKPTTQKVNNASYTLIKDQDATTKN